MDDDGDVLAARPTPLVEVRPQEWALRHTEEHTIDIVPFVQILDVPCAGGEAAGGSAAEDRHFYSRAVYEVPKIFPDRIPKRSVERRPPQKAEQLVEVPTILYFSSRKLTLVVFVELLEVFKVLAHDRVWSALVSSTLTFQLVVVEIREVFKVFLQDRVRCSRLWNRSLTFQFPEVACKFSLILALQAHPQYRVMSVGNGFFALFPDFKQVRSPPRVRVRGCTDT